MQKRKIVFIVLGIVGLMLVAGAVWFVIAKPPIGPIQDERTEHKDFRLEEIHKLSMTAADKRNHVESKWCYLYSFSDWDGQYVTRYMVGSYKLRNGRWEFDFLMMEDYEDCWFDEFFE